MVTNIEADHLDHYGTLENIEKTFCKFMSLVGEDGTVIINGDVPHYVELARSTGRRVLTYGFDESCDYVCHPEEMCIRDRVEFAPRRNAHVHALSELGGEVADHLGGHLVVDAPDMGARCV